MERDIVLHKLPDEEIRNRLEQEIVGQEISEWLKSEIDKVRNKSDELLSHAEDADSFCKEWEALDVGLKYERIGRLDKYMDDMQIKLNAYVKRIRKLLRWLNLSTGIPQVKSDKYLREVLLRTRDELNDLHEKVKFHVLQANDKIRALVKASKVSQGS